MPTPATWALTRPCTERCTSAPVPNSAGPRRRSSRPAHSPSMTWRTPPSRPFGPSSPRTWRRPKSCPTIPTSAARPCTGLRTCCRSPKTSARTTPPRPCERVWCTRSRTGPPPTAVRRRARAASCTTREVRGLVGKVASFGSDEFNDHHFHYGYLLYAAAIAVQDDPSLQKRLQPVMDLVAADLATDGGSSFFPDQRAFDAYAGHSWASGYVPFRDGNNQESSSEAVAAWNGLALWADATDNQPLADEARWMLANEAASAQAYWVGFDQDQDIYEGYDHADRRPELGQQARLRHVVQRGAGGQARHPVDSRCRLSPPTSRVMPSASPRTSMRVRRRVMTRSSATTCSCIPRLRGPRAAADALALAQDDPGLPSTTPTPGRT